MSLYSEYIKEREGKDIVEVENGFATYTIYPNGECYIQDIYVRPEFRKSGLAKEMADDITVKAKAIGCHTLLGSVCVDDLQASRNARVLMAYGMDIKNIIGNMIFFKKGIE